ncbi:enoyl-CoA hydratase/isomerase family protein [Homoserinimonas sp. A447]
MTDVPRATTASLGETPVVLSRSGPVAWLHLNRPERFNTVTADLLDHLLARVEEVAATPEVRVLVLTGAGRAFCAGGDLKTGVGGGVLDGIAPDRQQDRLRSLMQISQLLRTMPAITIAAVNGACAGAGVSLAAAADLRIAQSNARFTTAFLTAGVSGDFGGTWLLTRLLGSARARELYLLPAPFGAERAERIGLVSEVCDDVVARASAIANELVAAPPMALALMKRNLVDADELTFEQSLDQEAARMVRCIATEDAAEATRAFVERRAPSFTGR